MNMFPCAIGMLSFIRLPSFTATPWLRFGTLAVAPGLLLLAWSTRVQFFDIEQQVRFEPAAAALDHVRAGEPIVTDTPMCARLLAAPTQDIRDRGDLIDSVLHGAVLPEPSFLVVQEHSTTLDSRDLPGLSEYKRAILKETEEFRIIRFER
jgi:hypothetical protein